jgi:integrase
MPNYTKSGKILIPLSEETFIDGMTNGKFVTEKHKALCALLYYTGVRITEALRAKKEQFTIQKGAVYFDVGKRLKHGEHTFPLKVPFSKPFTDLIQQSVEETKQGKRVFPYCRATGYNVVARVFTYPHHFRLTRISFLAMKFSVLQLVNYTGLNPATLKFYMGRTDIEKMGEA